MSGRRFQPNSLFFCGLSNESAFGGNLVAEVVENGGFSGRARVNFPDALDVDASAGHPVTGAEQRVDLVGRRIGILCWEVVGKGLALAADGAVPDTR